MTYMVYKLLLKQVGKCQYCQQQIDENSKWNIHHIKPIKKGGSDSIDNLCLLHPYCHRQLHSRHTAGLPVQGNLIYA